MSVRLFCLFHSDHLKWLTFGLDFYSILGIESQEARVSKDGNVVSSRLRTMWLVKCLLLLEDTECCVTTENIEMPEFIVHDVHLYRK